MFSTIQFEYLFHKIQILLSFFLTSINLAAFLLGNDGIKQLQDDELLLSDIIIELLVYARAYTITLL